MSATRPGFQAGTELADEPTRAAWFGARRAPKAGGDRSRRQSGVKGGLLVDGSSALADDPSESVDLSMVDLYDDDDPASPLPRDDAERMTHVLKAVAHPARLQLISIVQAGEHGEACVSEMTAPLGLSQPAVSHHLKILVDAGLMRRVRRGNWAWYSFVPASLEAILEALKLL